MNKVVISGWLQFEPEIKVVGSKGISMLQNVVSVKDKFKGADGKYKYHNVRIKAYRHTADFIGNYIHKGDKILLEGSLDVYRTEEGKEYVSVVASDVEIIEAKRTATKQAVSKSDEGFFEGFSEMEGDDIPF